MGRIEDAFARRAHVDDLARLQLELLAAVARNLRPQLLPVVPDEDVDTRAIRSAYAELRDRYYATS